MIQNFKDKTRIPSIAELGAEIEEYKTITIRETDEMVRVLNKDTLSLIDYFLNKQDLKKTTKSTYRRALKQFFLYAEHKGLLLDNLTFTDIVNYKNDLLIEGKSALTISSYLTVLKSFFTFLEANKIYPNIAKGVKLPKRTHSIEKQPLEVDEVKKLLKFVKRNNLRDYAIINLLLRTGLRTIEVIRLNYSDITYKQGQRVLKVQGKGRDIKDDFVILTDKAYKPIQDYLKSRDFINTNSPIFVSNSNHNRDERLTTRSISRIVKNALIDIDLDGKEYTAHSLRHTTAVQILKGGGTIEQAQKTLRHRNPATTQIYTHHLDEVRRLQNSGESLIDNLF